MRFLHILFLYKGDFMDDNKTINAPGGSCSFCGRPRGAFKEIVENPNGSVGICNDCIKICREILENEERKRQKEVPFALPNPEKIKKFLRKEREKSHLRWKAFPSLPLFSRLKQCFFCGASYKKKKQVPSEAICEDIYQTADRLHWNL